jgi:hypothetical protein
MKNLSLNDKAMVLTLTGMVMVITYFSMVYGIVSTSSYEF